jgi:hypothetical protein
MGLFNLFKKKGEENKEFEKPKEFEGLGLEDSKFVCVSCGQPIEQWEKTKTFEKKKYHVKCMRKLRKQAMKMYTSGQM